MSPRAFEALQLKLSDVLRKNGDKPEVAVGSKVKELAMAAGKGFATEAGKQAASGLLSFVINWVAGGGAAKGLGGQVADYQESIHPRAATPDASRVSECL